MDWIERESHRKYHEVADIFPLMDGQEYDELKADIAKNGLIEKIWLHSDGSIIDGRNRHRACIETETRPEFRTWHGSGSLVVFVVSLNIHRRHLSSSQRAVIALEVLPKLEAEAKERMIATQNNKPVESAPQIVAEQEKGEATEHAAEMFQTNRQYVKDAKKLQEEAPDLLEEVNSGEKTIPQAKKELRKRKREKEREEMAQKASDKERSDRWNVWNADIATWNAPRKYDFIITDPPYEKEYIPLYGVLAERSIEWLKPGGLVLAMCGQSYLDEIMALMSSHLQYYWTGCYLTPGQPTPLRTRQVNTTWKPILCYALPGERYSGKIFGDVWKSDRNEKDHHKWGQSISGMLSMVSQVCLPGQYILDPFCGAGTTGIAAIRNGCFFDGIDIDDQNVGIAITRISDDEAS